MKMPGSVLKKFCFLLLFLTPGFRVQAQTYPPYNINICDSASAGYYFLCALRIGPPNGIFPTQMILDSLGRTVYYKEFIGGGGDFKVQPNGQITYEHNGQYFIMDSTFTIVDSVSCGNGISTDGHDLQILPNGHFLLLGYENVNMNLSSYLLFGPNHTLPGSANATVKCGVVQEQDANHNVVFEWHAKDHYAFSDVDTSRLNSPSNVDWTHMNAVELDDDGNILVSVRHFNEITKINRSDSSIIWRLGGNANQFSFTNDSNEFKGQHDIRRIANGDLTIFDNGAGNPLHPATGKEYQLDENLMTATLVWSYVENPNAFSQAIGNHQRLPNGNSLINFGSDPAVYQVFDVVDAAGNKIFEIQFADTLRSYRAFNYPSLPLQLPRPQITCTTIASQVYLDAGSGYASYLWSTGATTQMIPVTTADTFSVWVSIGAGGFIRSDYFVVTNPGNPCAPAAVENQDGPAGFSISPNPATDQVIIQSEFENKNIYVEIFDFTGKLVFSDEMLPEEDKIILPVSDFPKGIYLVRVNGAAGRFAKM